MSNGAAAGAAAAHAARMNAIKASGVLIKVDNRDFISLLEMTEKPLIVYTEKSFWRHNYQYLTSVKGLAFYTKSPERLLLPGDAIIIRSESISIPS